MLLESDRKYSIPLSYWKDFNENQLDEFVEDIFYYYRNHRGFPFFELSKEERDDIFNKLQNFDSKSILKEDNVLSQNMLGLNLCNYYMPHMWFITCNGFTSPWETFSNNDLFRKAIKKRLKLGTNISDAGIRKTLCWSNGAQRVSNFRPTVAKYIYDTYGNQGKVLDFSAGYGGRLIGALSSSINYYMGVDPCQPTVKKLHDIICDTPSTKGVMIWENAFEDISFDENAYDLIFSSPPYFNTEHYANASTQSWVRYETKELWREKFLKEVMDRSYTYLKNDGYFIINVANVKTYPELELDTIGLALNAGFRHVKTYKMALSNLMKSGFKYEPIFVFKKC